MKKIRITEKQAALLKKLRAINETEGEESGVKSVGVAMGDKVIRIVISGDNVAKVKDRIIQLILRQDPQAKVGFFEATGKIVGNVKDIRLDSIVRDLKMLDPTISVENKPISKSIKENAKKIKITKEQYNRLIAKPINEQEVVKGGADRVDKVFKKDFQSVDVKNLGEESTFDIKKPNLGIPKLSKDVGHRKEPVHESDNLKSEVSELIKFLYKKTNALSSFWEKHGITIEDICKALETRGVLLSNNGNYELSKSLGSPEAAINAVEDTVSKMLETNKDLAVATNAPEKELAEVGGLPAGAENDSTAPFNQPKPQISKAIVPSKKQYEAITYNQEIAILKDAKGGLYVFDYYNLPKESFAPYAQVEKTYIGKDDEGQPDFDYGDFEIDANVIENYVNDNIERLPVGNGAADFESGIAFVKIDSGLKNELLNLFDKNKAIVNALASIEEEVKPEDIASSLKSQLSPPVNPVKKTPEAIKAVLAKKKAEEMDRRKAAGEVDEMTSAGSSATGGSSGPFTGPLNSPVVKRTITAEEIIDETTVAGSSATGGSSGPYDANALPNISRDGTFKKGKKTKAQTKTQWAGGGFVELNDCTKLNNGKGAQNGGCSSGAADSVVSVKKTKGNINAPSLSESEIYEKIAKQTGKTIDEVKTIIESKISKSN